jgi:hypothetical protein
MTEKLEIRAKSMEMAIKLLGLAIEKNAANITKDGKIGIERPFVLGTADELFDDASSLSKKIEAFIQEPL